MHPDPGELPAGAARLGELVLVVGEDEVQAAAVDLEARSQKAFGHGGALDVPAGTANSPRRLPERVLAFLVPLPEREIARILLERVLLLRFHLVGPLAGQPAVVGEAGDAVVDVALRLVGEAHGDELLDQGDDLRDRLGRLRLEVGPSEPELVRVLDVPAARVLGQLGARARGRRVDLVVDVGDVLCQRHVVAGASEPAREPHGQDERAGVADVDPLVDGWPANVHRDRLTGLFVKRFLFAGERAVHLQFVVHGPLSLVRCPQIPVDCLFN